MVERFAGELENPEKPDRCANPESRDRIEGTEGGNQIAGKRRKGEESRNSRLIVGTSAKNLIAKNLRESYSPKLTRISSKEDFLMKNIE